MTRTTVRNSSIQKEEKNVCVCSNCFDLNLTCFVRPIQERRKKTAAPQLTSPSSSPEACICPHTKKGRLFSHPQHSPLKKGLPFLLNKSGKKKKKQQQQEKQVKQTHSFFPASYTKIIPNCCLFSFFPLLFPFFSSSTCCLVPNNFQ